MYENKGLMIIIIVAEVQLLRPVVSRTLLQGGNWYKSGDEKTVRGKNSPI